MRRITSFLLITAALLSSCAPQRLSARQSLKESSQWQSDRMKDVMQSLSSIRTQLLDLSSRLNISDTSTLTVETETVSEVFDTSSQNSRILSRTVEKSSAKKKYGVYTTSEANVAMTSSSSDTSSLKQTSAAKTAGQTVSESKNLSMKKTGLSWYQKGLVCFGSATLAYIVIRLALLYFKPQLSGIATLIKNLLNKIKI